MVQKRWRAVELIMFLLVGSFTEGISVVLLIPILRFTRPGSGIAIPGLSTVIQGNMGLAITLAGFVCVIALRGLLTRHTNVTMIATTLELVNTLRVDLFSAIAYSKWGFLSTLRTADLDHALSIEVSRVQFTISSLFASCQAALLLLIYIVISLVISPWMTLLASLFGLVLFLLMRPVRRATTAFGEVFTSQNQRQQHVISAFIGSVKTAKSFNAEPAYIAKFSSELEAGKQSHMKLAHVGATGALVSQVFTAAAMGSFAFTAVAVFHLPFTKLAVLLFALMRMAPRMTGLQESAHQIMVNLPAFETMRRLKQSCDAAREFEAATNDPPMLRHRLRFEAVGYTYAAQDRASITDASFEIPAHQITAFIGPSGSGKTTLADLLMGLIEPQTGRIMIDDIELTGENRRSWRSGIAYVPQEVVLTHDTILANLRLAYDDVSEAEIWHALEQANASGFVSALPDGLLTIVGERGIRFSGGERQRIALARALLRRPELLILDEGTSALDWQSQALIAESVERLRGKVTVVTIAHRPSMIAVADWVVAIDGGQIVETGAYAEIAARPQSRLRQVLAAERVS
jgi:ATP-binding cassette subfamily C protein